MKNMPDETRDDDEQAVQPDDAVSEFVEEGGGTDAAEADGGPLD